MQFNLRKFYYSVTVSVYRTVAAIVLFGVLFGVAGYGFYQAFYVASTSWVAPVLVSPSNDRILEMTSALVTSQQALDTVTLDRNRLEQSLTEMFREKTELLGLDSQLSSALKRQKSNNMTAGTELVQMNAQKRDDITTSAKLSSEIEATSDQIEKDRQAGLITKGEAAQQRASIAQFHNSLTDSKVEEILLRDSVRSKTTTDIDTLQVLSKRADLKAAVAQLVINISIGMQQLSTDKSQIVAMGRAIAVVKESPFYLATQGNGKLGFAFVPYENQAQAKPGALVYDCYLNMMVCRVVGTVKHVFSDEQHVIHPIFKTDIRGFFVRLELDNSESIKSKTLFLGRKPLLF